MKLIGLAGAAGVGKNTVADALNEYAAYWPIAFADPLKDAVMAKFGLTYTEMNDRDSKDAVHPFWGITPRQMMQAEGMLMRHRYGADFWIRRAFMEIDDSARGDRMSWVISDVRFESEALAIRARGGKIIQITRPNNPFALTGAAADHISEQPLPAHLIDGHIYNVDDENQLYDSALDVVRHLFEGTAS